MKYFPNIKIEIVVTEDDIELGVKPKKYQKKQKNSYLLKGGVRGIHKTKNRKYFSSSYNNIQQNCTVRASYRNTKDLHMKNLEYIQKEGKGIDGESPLLYGSLSEEEYRKIMVDKNWRIILSPQSNSIDLNILTEEFIKKLENETGYRLNYLAANHYDTDNHHTHILINGTDQNGKDVNFIPREKVTVLMREFARDICTNLIGYRKEDEIDNDYKKMIKGNYFTKLDKILEKKIDENNELNKNIYNNKYEIELNQRLQYLIQLQLLEFDKKKQKYRFKENWKNELNLLGKYNTYYDGYNYSQTTPDNYKLHEISKDGEIEGTILKKYIRQKDSNNFALVLKINDSESRYVPLSFYPKDCHIGDKIKIEKKDQKTYIKNYTVKH